MSTCYNAARITANGEAYGAGYNGYGKLANGGTNNYQTVWSKAKLENITQVAYGYHHAMYLTSDGKLYGAGRNYHGALGISTHWRSNAANSNPLFIMDDVIQVECGYWHTVVLKSNGDVYTFGEGGNGQRGASNNSDTWQPVKVFSGGIKIAAGVYNTFVINTENELYACGYNSYGQVYGGSSSNYNYFIKSADDVIDIAAGHGQSMIVKTDGSAWCSGRNYYGELGISSNYRSNNRNGWRQVFGPDTSIAVYCAHHTSFVLKNDGTLIGFGYNAHGLLNQGTTWTYSWTHRTVDTNVISVSPGIYNVSYIKDDGYLYTCGYNGYGELGVGNTSNYYTSRKNSNDVIKVEGIAGYTVFVNTGNTESFHKESAEFYLTLQHRLNKECQYRIFVNNEKVFPSSSEWTQMQPTPFDVYKKIPSGEFDLGTNKVRIEFKDEFSVRTSYIFSCEKTNQVPQIQVRLSGIQVHAEDVSVDAKIVELDDDPVQYKILLNDKQVYPTLGFTSLSKNRDFKWIFPNEQLDVGLNVIKIKYKDDLQLDEQLWTTQIIKINTNPSIIGDVKGAFINIDIDDTEKDRVKYKLLLDGKQIFPDEGYTGLVDTPFKIEYRIPNKFINLNSDNTLIVEAIDSLNGTTTKNFVFTGVYSGLMFCDYDETWYSNDIGEVLKYLDFGTIIAGQITPAERVYVKNTLGYPVENIRISTRQGELDGQHARVEISELDAPFMAQDTVAFTDSIQHDDKVSFFVRIKTDRQAHDGGMFDILVRADPANKDNT